MSQPNHARNIGVMILAMSLIVMTLLCVAAPVSFVFYACMLVANFGACFGAVLFATRGRAIQKRDYLTEAAPEMLHALRRAALVLAWMSEKEESPAIEDDYNAVSAAISKAMGATQ